MIRGMNGLSFASSLIGHLVWPLVVAGAIVIFRKPLSELIGRVRHYEGLGQRMDFGPALAEAEDAVGKAVHDAPRAEKQAQNEPSSLAREAEVNPSYVVLQAWEQLSAAIADLAGIVLPGQRIGQWNSWRFLPELQKRELLTADLVNAVNDLRNLRNQVAHGQSNPTPGEAVAYADSAQVLAVVARNVADLLANPPLVTEG
jgi:hypothetical protein